MVRGVVLGIDAGGTRTRALVLDLATGARGRATTDGANWTVHGAPHCVARIREVAAMAYPGVRPDSVALCVAGYYPRDHAAEAGEAVRSLWPRAFAVVRPDIQGAWAGALDCEPGILAICGTGSIAFGRGRTGAEARAGGWGPLFGDTGSAYWVGLAALRYLAEAADGMAADSDLAVRLPAARPHGDAPNARLREWLRGIYRLEWNRERIAGLASDVVASARTGDAVAAGLLEQAGIAMGRLITAVERRLSESDLSATFTGGLAENSPELTDAAARELARAGSTVRLQPPCRTAVEGAVLLAAEALGGAEAQSRARALLDGGR